jgi:hypothetical protein
MFISGTNYKILEDDNALCIMSGMIAAGINLYTGDPSIANPMAKVQVNISLRKAFYKTNDDAGYGDEYYQELADDIDEYTGDANVLALMADEVFKEDIISRLEAGEQIISSEMAADAELSDIIQKYFEHKNEIENPEIDPEIAAEVEKMAAEAEAENAAEEAEDEEELDDEEEEEFELDEEDDRYDEFDDNDDDEPEEAVESSEEEDYEFGEDDECHGCPGAPSRDCEGCASAPSDVVETDDYCGQCDGEHCEDCTAFYEDDGDKVAVQEVPDDTITEASEEN